MAGAAQCAPALLHAVAGSRRPSIAAFGDVYLNYRYQALEEGPGRPAFSPRVSLIVPTGRPTAALGEAGLQINLPFSKQRGDLLPLERRRLAAASER